MDRPTHFPLQMKLLHLLDLAIFPLPLFLILRLLSHLFNLLLLPLLLLFLLLRPHSRLHLRANRFVSFVLFVFFSPSFISWKRSCFLVLAFIYSHDFDDSGIMYFLGTCGRTKNWQNPQDLGLVQVTASSLMADSAPASSVVGYVVIDCSSVCIAHFSFLPRRRTAVRCVSRPQQNSWFCIDLLSRSAAVTHYSLKHYSAFDGEALRNWRFEVCAVVVYLHFFLRFP
jgi:hypothetical protein